MYSSLLTLQIQTWLEEKKVARLTSCTSSINLNLWQIFFFFLLNFRSRRRFNNKLSLNATTYDRNNSLTNLTNLKNHTFEKNSKNRSNPLSLQMIRLQGTTLSPENWKENSRNPFPTMLIQSNVGNNRSLKTRIYRETLVDTPCNNYSTFAQHFPLHDRFESGCNPRISIDRS